jgi:hypothetical protein
MTLYKLFLLALFAFSSVRSADYVGSSGQSWKPYLYPVLASAAMGLGLSTSYYKKQRSRGYQGNPAVPGAGIWNRLHKGVKPKIQGLSVAARCINGFTSGLISLHFIWKVEGSIYNKLSAIVNFPILTFVLSQFLAGTGVCLPISLFTFSLLNMTVATNPSLESPLSLSIKNRSDRFTQEFIEGNPEAYFDYLETLKRQDGEPDEYKRNAAWAKRAIESKYGISYEDYKKLKKAIVTDALEKPFDNPSLGDGIGAIIDQYASID